MKPNRLIQLFKDVVAFVIYLLGIPWLVREWICKNKVTILLYHDVSSKIFDKHIDHLIRHYNIISLESLVTAIYNQDSSEIPPKSVVITFDDGHANNFELLSIFQKYSIRPTIYVCTQIINTNRHFWFKIDGLSKKEKEHLKKIPNEQRITYLKKISNFESFYEYNDRQALNIDELKQMIDYVDIQPHTQTHPILPNCTKSECQHEILKSKIDLETMLDIECNHFSYPNGDYTEREIEIVKECGYRSARTTDIGWNSINTSPYRLKAIPITDTAGNVRFCSEMSSIPQRLAKIANTILWRKVK
ncbi:polysaccharide deacetylase family protein [Candidatus Poribacteria bacterium]|nr:polysaccharide deacetylase family protein [Candidatus Poribacteria bacterium]